MSLFGRTKEPSHGPEDLQRAILHVAAATSEEELVEKLRSEVARLVGGASAAIFLFDHEYHDLHGRALSGKKIRFGLGQGAAGWAAKELSSWRSDHPAEAEQYDPAIDGLAGGQPPESLLAVPIVCENGELRGVAEAASSGSGSFSEEDAAYLEMLCETVSGLLDAVARISEWRSLTFRLAGAVGLAVDTRLGVMVNRSARVRELAAALGQAAGLTQAEMECLDLAASLQDMGRMQAAACDGTDMGGRNHVFFAEAFMRSVAFPERLRRVQEIACAQEERFDGSGFPRGVRGEEVPRAARILTVVNAFDTLTFSPGPDGRPLDEKAALAKLRELAGSAYDPELVELFISKRVYDREKRMHARLERQAPVDATPLLPDGQEGQSVECSALDLSSGGALLSYPGELPAGSLLRLVIHMPGERLEAMGRVVRATPASGSLFRVGVTFLWQGAAGS